MLSYIRSDRSRRKHSGSKYFQYNVLRAINTGNLGPNKSCPVFLEHTGSTLAPLRAQQCIPNRHVTKPFWPDSQTNKLVAKRNWLEWGGDARTRDECQARGAGRAGPACPPSVRACVRHAGVPKSCSSKMLVKPLVCARFQAWGHKKVVFIWIAKTKAKWSKFWSFLPFWTFMSRNVTFFALKAWLTFDFDDKCEKWQNFDAKTSYTSKKVASVSFFTFFTNH